MRIFKFVGYAVLLYVVYLWAFNSPSSGFSLSLIIGGAVAVFILYQMIEIGSSFFKIVLAAGIVLAIALYGRPKDEKSKAKPLSASEWINEHKPERGTVERQLVRLHFDPKSATSKKIEDLLSKS